MPAVSVIAASSNLGGAYSLADLNDKMIVTATPFLTAAGQTTGWFSYDFGSAKTFDSSFIASNGYSADASIKDGSIQYSSDNSSWSTAATFADLFVGAATTTKMALVTFAAQTARYWRVNITANYGNVNYVGCNEWLLWDSTLIGSELDNAGGFVLTGPGASVASASEMSNRSWATYGFYYNLANNTSFTFEWDFGSAQYVGGLEVLNYAATTYEPQKLYVYTSTNGTTWTFAEVVSVTAELADSIQAINFSRIYSTRYFKFFPISGSTGVLWREWFINATLTPATPPVPTSLVVTGDSDDATSLQLRWSQAAGDDNVVADLQWEVQRSFNAGAMATIATVVAPGTGLQEYIDTGLAAGTYSYQVRSAHRYHAQASAYTAASTAIMSPIAAAGGGGGAHPALSIGAGTRGL